MYVSYVDGYQMVLQFIRAGLYKTNVVNTTAEYLKSLEVQLNKNHW